MQHYVEISTGVTEKPKVYKKGIICPDFNICGESVANLEELRLHYTHEHGQEMTETTLRFTTYTGKYLYALKLQI